MKINLNELICPKIQKSCVPMWEDGYYKNSAHEAMILVEKGLKEKGLIKNATKTYGRTLVKKLFQVGDKSQTIKLRVPLGEDLQTQAEIFFDGVFAYYRNYLAHDGSKIDKHISLRILIIASELLDMIDASSLSFSDIGGVNGLIESGSFDDKEQLLSLLTSLENQYYPDGEIDGLREHLFEKYGIVDHQIDAVFELDLVRYYEEEYIPNEDEKRLIWSQFSPPETMDHFKLTKLGQQFINEIQNKL
jgi:hypothetical protein